MQGSGGEEIEFRYFDSRGRTVRRKHKFEGILPNLERRYHETESLAVREELARYLGTRRCPECDGARLTKRGAHSSSSAARRCPRSAPCPSAARSSSSTRSKLEGWRQKIAAKIVKEIADRLGFLVDVGLDYLTLDRSAETLSGGEAQRIRLASQIGSGLVGVMYILDEPSIGLHQRDNQRLLDTLHRLRDLGNTVIVVEHDEDAIRQADHVVDLGPGAGVHGGRVVAQGTPAQIEASPPRSRASTSRAASASRSRTKRAATRAEAAAAAAAGERQQPEADRRVIPRRPADLRDRRVGLGQVHARQRHALSRGRAPLDLVADAAGALRGRRGPRAPSTASSTSTRARSAARRARTRRPTRASSRRSASCSPARPEARSRGYQPGRFSFNVKGGRCEACQGDGVIKVEMHFLPDVYVACDVCKGRRYNRETLEVHYKGKNIHEVLDMTVEDAAAVLRRPCPSVASKLQTLLDVGLSYVKLGQNATTLSGGEAQRVKLAKELSKRATGRTLYILDEPTTGLHFEDVKHLLAVLHRLRDEGNTVIVIEHNLDVIKTADWVIDLGPEGGDGGGSIVAEGTPEQLARAADSFTGRYLKRVLARGKKAA